MDLGLAELNLEMLNVMQLESLKTCIKLVVLLK